MGEISDALTRFKGRKPGAQLDREPSVDSSASGSAGLNGTASVGPTTTKEHRTASLLGGESQPAEGSDVPLAKTQDISDSDAYRVERISALDPNSPVAASARQLAQKVKRQAAHRGIRTLVITSPLSGDGKTTVSCNLAIALTSLDRSRSVALVDLDLRRPSVAERLGLSVECGIDDVLGGQSRIEDALLSTNVPGLTVVAVREARPSPELMLSSDNLKAQIESLEDRFSMVIIDTPPILLVSDALSVIDAAQGALLVVRAGTSPTASVRGAVEHLPAEKMLGCCLNYAQERRPTEHYESYYPVASPSPNTPPTTALPKASPDSNEEAL